MPSVIDLASFREQALARGYDEVVERDWPPGTELPVHTHPFDLLLRVVAGEMTVSTGEGDEALSRTLQVGDHLLLDADVPHAERYGPEGARYWVARRHR